MLLFIDGFDHYGPVPFNGNILRQGVYAETNLGTGGVKAGIARTGQYALLITADNSPGVRRVLPGGAVETCGVGYAFSLGGLPTDSSSLGLLQWRTAENAILATLMVSSIGQVILQRGANGGPEIARSDVCIFPDSYQHFEAVRSPAGIEVRINGVTVLNNADPGVAGMVSQVKIGTNGVALTGMINSPMTVDDLFCWSGEGPNNNDFLGDVKVFTRMPTSDGPVQEWEPSIAGPGFAMIDNVPPLDSTEYLSAPPASGIRRSEFGIADFPEEIVSVRGVFLATRAFKTDAGNAKVRTGVMVDSAETLNPEHALSQAPVWYGDVFELNPATALAWSVDDLNDLQTVIERTE